MLPAPQVPCALKHLDDILPAANSRPIAVFLDFDGTLTPIVAARQDALLSNSMRATLRRLAQLCPVAVISGRDLADVRRRVALPNLYYAGSHGFQIGGPGGLEFEKGVEFLPQLDAAEIALRAALRGIAGCEVERKRLAIAVHYRRVEPAEEQEVISQTNSVIAGYPGLRLSVGKKILELQPGIPWNKGHAMLWLTQLWLAQSMKPDTLPVYLGDDATDEDAFLAVSATGVGILVAEQSIATVSTAAGYRLRNAAQVREFLVAIIKRLRRTQTATTEAPAVPRPSSAGPAEA